MIYIPNLLTLARIAMVPLLIVSLKDQQFLLSLILFIAAGLTDGLDGYIAKKFNAKTKLGAVLDPLADKALLMSSYVMLSLLELIPFWLMVAVVFRDVLIVCGYLVLEMFMGAVEMNPLKISKVNTFLQISYIVVVLASLAGISVLQPILLPLGYCVLITTVWSGAAYAYILALRTTQSGQDSAAG